MSNASSPAPELDASRSLSAPPPSATSTLIPSDLFGTDYIQTFAIIRLIVDFYLISDGVEDEPLLEYSVRADALAAGVEGIIGGGKRVEPSVAQSFWTKITSDIKIDYDGEGKGVDFIVDQFSECVKARSLVPLESAPRLLFTKAGRPFRVKVAKRPAPYKVPSPRAPSLPPRPTAAAFFCPLVPPVVPQPPPATGAAGGSRFNAKEADALALLQARTALEAAKDQLLEGGSVEGGDNLDEILSVSRAVDPSSEFEKSDTFRDLFRQAGASVIDSAPPEARETLLRSTDFRSVSTLALRRLAERGTPPIPIDVRVSIIRNDFVDLGKVHAFTPTSTASSLLAETLPSLFTERGSPSRAITDGNRWSTCWLDVVEYALLFYPNRRQEFMDYHRWVTRNISSQPALLSSILAYDIAFRSQLGSSHIGYTLADCNSSRSITLQMQFLHITSPPARPSSSSTNKRAADDDLPPREKQICIRYNNGDEDHGKMATLAGTVRISEEGLRNAEELLGLEGALLDAEDLVDPSYSLSGIGSSIRLRRSLHFPGFVFPSSVALDATLSAIPFDRPPPSASLDPHFLSATSSHPHLFTISTPLDVPRVAQFLEIHPNRPLIDSILVGLTQGFWPSHDGDFSGLKTNRQGVMSEEDIDFISLEKEEDWEKGRLSPPFSTLLPGMHISPTFVVHSATGKTRTVCDQSVSNLNSGILPSRAKTTYDTIPQLGRLLRYYRHRDLDAEFHTIWKSDVSSAFRNLPVCLEWMMKQVHRVRRRDGSKIYDFVVDQRLILGGRLSPLIWCTVINAILWCTRVHCRVPHIFIFVDDAFGIDVSGLSILVAHPATLEIRRVPLEQGRILQTWSKLGVPWSWKKQLFDNKELEIIGFKVSCTSLAVSLSDHAKAAFEEVALDFLDNPVLRRQRAPSQPLVKWQRLLGHANWACNVLPFAKFALHPLYDKTAGKVLRYAQVDISRVVAKEVRWLLNEIKTAPPLYLLDPALEEWTASDAEIVVYSDACLAADVSGLMGIGFHSKSNGSRSSFYHRADSPFASIIIAEALGVFSAVVWAVQQGSNKRILAYTDNSASVYAFDSGRATGDLFDIVRTTYDLLSLHGCDLRMQPVNHSVLLQQIRLDGTLLHASPFPLKPPPPTHRHSTVDWEEAPMSLPTAAGVVVKAPRALKFGHPNHFSKRRHSPPPSLEKLGATLDHLIENSIAKSTGRGYRRAFQHWVTFARTYALSAIPSVRSVSLFVTYLHLKHIEGIDKILSGLAHHVRSSVKDWDAIRSHPNVKRALQGAAKLSKKTIKCSPPLLPSHLSLFLAAATAPKATHDDLLACFIATVGFGALLRLGEMVEPASKEDRDERKYVRRSSVKFMDSDQFHFHLPYHKADRLYRGSDVVIVAGTSTTFNFVDLARTYVTSRDRLQSSSPFLFLRADGSLPTRAWFIKKLKAVAPDVTGHALRAGGATFLAQLHIPLHLIQRLGRWSSAAFEIYIRDHASIAAAFLLAEEVVASARKESLLDRLDSLLA